MKFCEFGLEHSNSLMLLHGNATTWQMSFGKCIPVLPEKYHVIAVGLDGFDPAELTEYLSGEDEAEKVVTFIRNHLGGGLDCLYGASLGCLPAIHASISTEIKVNHLILDGAENVSFGIFNPIMTKLVPKIEGKIVKKVVRGEAKFLIRMMGMQKYTPEMLAEMIYTGASERSLENATVAAADFYSKDIKKIPPQPDQKAACWYGSKEGNMKSAVKALRRVFPDMEVKAFEGYGHGEILQHPEQFFDEVDKFINACNNPGIGIRSRTGRYN